MLIIGSAAGVVVMGLERINFIWYLKNISLLALIGYLAGAGVYILQKCSIGIINKGRHTIMLWDFILRLFIAGILGAVIGLDMGIQGRKEAGYRTHSMVSLGGALIMIVSQYGFQQIIQESSVSLDPSRVAAQVVSGIGFIGQGTIIIQKQFVRGLTTAAGIWATAGIGLAIGAGMYGIGVSGNRTDSDGT